MVQPILYLTLDFELTLIFSFAEYAPTLNNNYILKNT